MSVQDVIDELQKIPNKVLPCKAIARTVFLAPTYRREIKQVDLDRDDATGVVEVRFEGTHVLIEGE